MRERKFDSPFFMRPSGRTSRADRSERRPRRVALISYVVGRILRKESKEKARRELTRLLRLLLRSSLGDQSISQPHPSLTVLRIKLDGFSRIRDCFRLVASLEVREGSVGEQEGCRMKVYGIGVLSDRLRVGSGLKEFLSETIRRQESGEKMRNASRGR